MFRLRSNQHVVSSGISNKVYVQNLDFQTTEDDLIEFLAPWNPKFVYIPYEIYVGLRNYHPRSNGKALVVFDHAEEATRMIDDLNGTLYKDKCLMIDYHIPFSPEKGHKRNIRTLTHEQVPGNTRLSKDTIYCRAIPIEYTYLDVKNMLDPYHPLNFRFIDTHDDSNFFHLLHPECIKDGMIKSVLVEFSPDINIIKVCNKLNESTGWHPDLQFGPAVIQNIDDTADADNLDPATQEG
ncbi:hypothetical protein MOSE0_D03466 [Monosporozyma servazzii]